MVLEAGYCNSSWALRADNAVCVPRAACSLLAETHDRDLDGWWFNPLCCNDKIHAATLDKIVS